MFRRKERRRRVQSTESYVGLITMRAVDCCARHTGQTGSCRRMECTRSKKWRGKRAKGHHSRDTSVVGAGSPEKAKGRDIPTGDLDKVTIDDVLG